MGWVKGKIRLLVGKIRLLVGKKLHVLNLEENVKERGLVKKRGIHHSLRFKYLEIYLFTSKSAGRLGTLSFAQEPWQEQKNVRRRRKNRIGAEKLHTGAENARVAHKELLKVITRFAS